MYQHYLNPFLIKIWLKSVDLSPKSFFWTSKQPFTIYFLLTTCNVCPVVIPEIFTQIQGSDYWPLIHCQSFQQYIKHYIKIICTIFWWKYLSLQNLTCDQFITYDVTLRCSLSNTHTQIKLSLILQVVNSDLATSNSWWIK